MRTYKRILTIAGSDSGGGAGIQADIKTITMHGCYAMSAITAVTVQNTLGVQSVMGVAPEVVGAQVTSVLSDIGADAVKIGMLYSTDVVCAVADALEKYPVKNMVLDTVLLSTSGKRLLMEKGVETMKECLFPMATVVTPNIPEASVLSGEEIESLEDMRRVSKLLSEKYETSFLVKGGHLKQDDLTDVLYDFSTHRHYEYTSKRMETKNTHGTGCTLSSAIACNLSEGNSLNVSIEKAKSYLNEAMKSGSAYLIGNGKGPMNHFFYLSNEL